MQKNALNAQTILNAVTGYPLGHSWSPQLHEIIYKSLDVNAVMLALPSQNIEVIIQAARTLPIHLLGVTLPHKQDVISYLDAVDETAKQIGAVNTVINRDGKLYGYNTDVLGIENAFKVTSLKRKNVLILGAGGAARPLCWFLQKQGAKILCHNRTHEKAEKLMTEFGGTAINNKELAEAKIDIIVNTTPVGMYPNVNESPFPKSLLQPHHTVLDLIYNPVETQLLKDAKQIGAKTISGMKIFISQALGQVQLWLGKAPNYEEIEKEFSKIINS